MVLGQFCGGYNYKLKRKIYLLGYRKEEIILEQCLEREENERSQSINY